MPRSSRLPSSAALPAKQMGGGCLVLFGLPFLAGGLAVALFWYLPTLGNWWSARHWEEVPCWIEQVELKTSRSSKGGSTHSTEARYRYQYHGRTYHSDEVGLMGGSDNIGDFQMHAHAELRAYAGTRRPFRCYVNPQQPEQAVLYRDLRWGLLLLLSLFPTLFPIAGLVIIGTGLRQRREASAGRLLQERHPGEPWRWRKEWEGEVITAQKGHGTLLFVVGAWALLVQAPLAAALLLSGEISRSPLAALGLLPSLLAAFPLALLWRSAQARRALGRPALWLRRTPVVPGEVLDGELRFDGVLSPLTTLDAHLLCQRHITRRSGKNTTTVKETIWEQHETLSAAEARREITGSMLPLRIPIPRGLPCTAVEDVAFVTGSDEKHVWTLEIKSTQSRRGVTLPLPMFLPPSAAAAAEAEELAHLDTRYEVAAVAPSTQQLSERLRTRGMRAEFDTAGLPTLIDCPPGRFRSLGLFLLFFGSIWFAAFLFMLVKGAPFIFQFVWGVSAPLILIGGLWTLLHHRRVELAADEMRVTDSAGPFYSRRQNFAPRHFIGFSHDSNMQSGSQIYYRVRGETTFGKKVTLIDGITESVTAEALSHRLEQWRGKV